MKFHYVCKIIPPFGPEWWAIYCCLEYLLHFIPNDSHIVIFTDSLSNVLKWDKIQRTTRALIEKNFNYLNENLLKMNCKVLIHWIPGHSNIIGNDIADQLAKQALNRNKIDILPIPSAVKSIQNYNSNIRTEYIKMWNKRPDNAIYYLSAKKPSNDKAIIHHGLRFQQSQWLTWCFINRAPLNHILHYMKYVDSPACKCGFYEENLAHYLFDCPLWLQQRYQMYANLNTSSFHISIQLLLKNDKGRQALIQFIASTRRFSQ